MMSCAVRTLAFVVSTTFSASVYTRSTRGEVWHCVQICFIAACARAKFGLGFVIGSARKYERRSEGSCVTFWPLIPLMWHVAQVGTNMSRADSVAGCAA